MDIVGMFCRSKSLLTRQRCYYNVAFCDCNTALFQNNNEIYFCACRPVKSTYVVIWLQLRRSIVLFFYGEDRAKNFKNRIERCYWCNRSNIIYRYIEELFRFYTPDSYRRNRKLNLFGVPSCRTDSRQLTKSAQMLRL